MDLGPHAAFIWTAYGATALIVTALVARAILNERRQKLALARLEAQGVRRRSADPAGDHQRP